jgi:hypothetical protein
VLGALVQMQSQGQGQGNGGHRHETGNGNGSIAGNGSGSGSGSGNGFGNPNGPRLGGASASASTSGSLSLFGQADRFSNASSSWSPPASPSKAPGATTNGSASNGMTSASAKTGRSTKRYSNNLFGSGAFRDQTYIRNHAGSQGSHGLPRQTSSRSMLSTDSNQTTASQGQQGPSRRYQREALGTGLRSVTATPDTHSGSPSASASVSAPSSPDDSLGSREELELGSYANGNENGANGSLSGSRSAPLTSTYPYGGLASPTTPTHHSHTSSQGYGHAAPPVLLNTSAAVKRLSRTFTPSALSRVSVSLDEALSRLEEDADEDVDEGDQEVDRDDDEEKNGSGVMGRQENNDDEDNEDNEEEILVPRTSHYRRGGHNNGNTNVNHVVPVVPRAITNTAGSSSSGHVSSLFRS